MEPENIWTHLWLEDCLDKGKIAPLQFFHQPIIIEPDFEPCKEVVIGKFHGFLLYFPFFEKKGFFFS